MANLGRGSDPARINVTVILGSIAIEFEILSTTSTYNQTYSVAMAAASSHPYTCNTCQVAFRGSELQRTHMQSDWQ